MNDKLNFEPDAIPSKLREVLEKQRLELEEWYSYSEVLRLKAEILQLKARLSRISKLTCSTFDEFLTESKEVRDLKQSVRNETDIISLNLTEALEYCRDRQSVKK